MDSTGHLFRPFDSSADLTRGMDLSRLLSILMVLECFDSSQKHGSFVFWDQSVHEAQR